MEGKFLSKKAVKAFFKATLVLISTVIILSSIGLSALATDGEGKERKLILGGFAFGVRFETKGVLVVVTSAFTSGGKEVNPAKEAGIKARDIIVAINGKEIGSASDVSGIVESSEGKALTVTVIRDGKELNFSLTPKMDDTDKVYKAGIELRDSMAGIGTVTYVDPESGEFGGLGHGICDPDTGVLMPLSRGSAIDVRIGGVVKGKAGKPGEIKGYFLSKRNGNVLSNTECGVFGYFAKIPETKTVLPVGSRNEIKDGKAEIYCTLGDDGVCKYEIEISKIDRKSTDNKSFIITVTDKALKERTGGIIQGMSGSPIVQNGKLVGAVTHVLVADPTKGYGIFIENMLTAS